MKVVKEMFSHLFPVGFGCRVDRPFVVVAVFLVVVAVVVVVVVAVIRLVHHYLDRVAHTCTVKNGTTSSPEYPRGSQCKPAEEYKGWMKGAEEKKGATT